MGRKITNIGVLDLRAATNESVADITSIGNVGMILYNRETAHLLTKLNIGNMGASVEAPANAKLVTGQMEITRDVLESITEPMALVLTGQLFVQPDLEAADIERCFSDIVITGQIVAPRHLLPVIQSKLKNQTGQMVAYSGEGRLIRGKAEITDDFLMSLDKGTILVIIGGMILLEPVNENLFQERIAGIELTGKAVIREEFRRMFYEKLSSQSQAKVEIIPAGFRYCPDPMILDSDNLRRMKVEKLYCRQFVRLEAGVTADEFDHAVTALKTNEYVICHESLKSVVLDKAVVPEMTVLTYAGKLIHVEGEETLTGPELEFTEGKVALLVAGELAIDPDVKPEWLIEKIEVVDNFGEISGNPRQLGALKARLRTRKGEMTDSTRETEIEEGLSNVGYLKL